MGFDLSGKIIEFLRQNPEQRFTAREIAGWIFQTYPKECRQKQKRSTAKITPLDSDAALVQQIVAEIGSHRPQLQKRYAEVKTTEGRPRRYYFTESSDRAEIDQAESKAETATSASVNRPERDLYPILSSFLLSELGIHSKRIDEKRSSNSCGAGGNKWLHPDVVGMEDLSTDWHGEVRSCVQQYGDKKTKLWSFEVKCLVNRSNVRESFFQAVSNSSWANFGYLVANEIEGASTVKELRILSSRHGIGFIQLDGENPAESQIVIPAKEHNEIDWNTVNRLAQENKDFLNYVKQVRQFYQTGDVPRTGWDVIPPEKD